MKPLFSVGGLYTEASGIARIVCDLANAMARIGTPVPVYSAVCNGAEPACHLLDDVNPCIIEEGQWMGRLSRAPELRKRLERDMPEYDVVHQHSIWMLPNKYASASARKHGKPVVFTTHGFLEPWALNRSRWKKWLVGKWFQDRDLRDAACIHVNSERELRSIRDYGLENPVAILPNGVDISPFEQMPDRSAFDARFPNVRGKKIALFLSRLHEKKGLGHLIEAWEPVRRDYPDWHLVLAGPDDGYEETAREKVDELGMSADVTFTGMMAGQDKIDAFAAADCFLLPSFSEGFAMAVLEGLAARLPVLITPGCNFPEVVEANAGVSVEPDVEGTEEGLRALLSLSDEERAEMGHRAYELVRHHYTWEAVAKETLRLYRWMVDGGEAPEFVRKG